MEPQPVNVSQLDAARSFHAAGLDVAESLALSGLNDEVAARWLQDARVRLVLRQARAQTKLDLLHEVANGEVEEGAEWKRAAWLLDYFRNTETSEAQGQTSPLPAGVPKKEP